MRTVIHLNRFHWMRGIVVILLAAAVRANGYAQSVQREVIVSTEIGALPDAFTSRCGRKLVGMPGIGGGLALRQTWSRRLVAQLDTRVVFASASGGCDADLPTVQLPNGVIESRPGAWFDDAVPTTPLATSGLRLGVAQVMGPARVSVTGGGGFVWARRPLPLANVAFAATLGGHRRALFVEVDRAQVWVRGTETRSQYMPGPHGTVNLGTRTFRRQFRPPWVTIRAGVALDLRSSHP